MGFGIFSVRATFVLAARVYCHLIDRSVNEAGFGRMDVLVMIRRQSAVYFLVIGFRFRFPSSGQFRQTR